MNVTLVPYGHTQEIPEKEVSEGYHWWRPKATYPLKFCQHGSKECFGNTMQACAIEVLETPERYVPLVGCMANYTPNFRPELTSFACSKKLDIPMSDMQRIKTCTLGDRGQELSAQKKA